jgi:hypothetical protein
LAAAFNFLLAIRLAVLLTDRRAPLRADRRALRRADRRAERRADRREAFIFLRHARRQDFIQDRIVLGILYILQTKKN